MKKPEKVQLKTRHYSKPSCVNVSSLELNFSELYYINGER